MADDENQTAAEVEEVVEAALEEPLKDAPEAAAGEGEAGPSDDSSDADASPALDSPVESTTTPVRKRQHTPRAKTTSCTTCNKSVYRSRWYYRNGAYYCNKRCWRQAQQEATSAAGKAS